MEERYSKLAIELGVVEANDKLLFGETTNPKMKIEPLIRETKEDLLLKIISIQEKEKSDLRKDIARLNLSIEVSNQDLVKLHYENIILKHIIDKLKGEKENGK